MSAFMSFFMLLSISICLSHALLDADDCRFKYSFIQGGNVDVTVLETLNGKVLGKCSTITVNNPDNPFGCREDILSWQSIPYAEAPVKSLRFKAPVAVKNWNNVKDGTNLPPKCVQFKTDYATDSQRSYPQMQERVSEDCLYLNIYTPALYYISTVVYKNPVTLLPILVYIHGGSFITGSSRSDYYDGSTVASVGKVIVVTLNYRVGALGFMYVDGTDMAGNQGFLDQSLALKWIFDNAMRFGGDPNKITIAGESAGKHLSNLHKIVFDEKLYLFFLNTNKH